MLFFIYPINGTAMNFSFTVALPISAELFANDYPIRKILTSLPLASASGI